MKSTVDHETALMRRGAKPCLGNKEESEKPIKNEVEKSSHDEETLEPKEIN